MLDDFVGDVARRRMTYTFDEAVGSVSRVARCPAKQLAFHSFRLLYGLVDAAPARPPSDRIEEIHEARTEEQAAGKTR
ncbi:MAG TPA: hypothetical protein VL326_06985 [Kofleriaceae bacterium]|nr:hypothetical protein [Kofleriaceae bacterium]